MAFQPEELNDFLSSRSYIEGYVPSQADVAVLEYLGGKSVDASLCHLLRWQRHISSYSAGDRLAFPGIIKVYWFICNSIWEFIFKILDLISSCTNLV